jgi:lipopolysaccharide/colanic/teichoic acid biosynthesis glycosyltransferase
MARPQGKRVLDLALLLPASPLYGTLLAGLALLVWATNGRPVFFAQSRVGRGGRPITVLKLRTMTCEARAEDRRPTAIGSWLRHRGLDEVPQLLSVLRGDMSLVGPRPLTFADHDRLVAEYAPFAARIRLPPGITGLAQVCQARGVRQSAHLDTLYARHRSALLDVRILARTVWVNLVGKARGAWCAEWLEGSLAAG